MSVASRAALLAPPSAGTVSPPLTSCRQRPQRPFTRCNSASASRADALLIDAQNILSRSLPPSGAARLPGDGMVAGFADWLQFLSALAGEPQLVVAVFDAPRSKRTKQQQREQLAAEYLQRRKLRREQEAPRPAPGGDPLRPFKQQVQQLGGVCMEAAAGWEADDGLAAASAAVQAHTPSARILVASGDGDMQQLLAPRVAWLQLYNQASLECPLGVELVTARDFQRLHGFPPAAHPDWLALTGKKEASIRGADVGAKTAAKLLARYGSLEAVLAAAAGGQLKGWGPAIPGLLGGGSGGAGQGSSSGSSHSDRLRRNRQLFAANDDPAVVEPRGMQQLLAAVEHLQPAAAQPWDSSDGSGSSGCSGGGSSGSSIEPSAELAWRYPLHARRWRHLQQLAQAVEQRGSSRWEPQQAATPHGLAVDEVLEAPAGICPGTAAFDICPCDVVAGGWPKAVAAGQQQPEVDGGHTRALLPLLHGRMKHHVRLVQRVGYRVQLRLPPPALLPGAVGGN